MIIPTAPLSCPMTLTTSANSTRMDSRTVKAQASIPMVPRAFRCLLILRMRVTAAVGLRASCKVDRYEGMFKDSNFNGLGVYCWKQAGSRYEGEFVDNLFSGLAALWNKDGKLIKCGRWEKDKLVDSCAVPLRVLPEKRYLSAHARTASLLYPDGSYFVGPLNRATQRHGQGRMFDANGDAIQSGRWNSDQLQRRKALLIGNDNYQPGLSKLHCCNNDAIDMQSALEEVDFDCTLVLDGKKRKMTDELTAFIVSLQPHDLVWLFFSGHGADEEGDTFLLPTDFQDGTYHHDAVGLNSILEDLNRKDCNLTSIVVLDCCRADDVNVTFRGSSRAVDRAVRRPATGTFFIIKASDPGTVAHESRHERNGYYTGCLLRYLTQPGLSLTRIIGKTGIALEQKSKGKQRSWITATDQFFSKDLVLKPTSAE